MFMEKKCADVTEGIFFNMETATFEENINAEVLEEDQICRQKRYYYILNIN